MAWYANDGDAFSLALVVLAWAHGMEPAAYAAWLLEQGVWTPAQYQEVMK